MYKNINVILEDSSKKYVWVQTTSVPAKNFSRKAGWILTDKPEKQPKF